MGSPESRNLSLTTTNAILKKARLKFSYRASMPRLVTKVSTTNGPIISSGIQASGISRIPRIFDKNIIVPNVSPGPLKIPTAFLELPIRSMNPVAGMGRSAVSKVIVANKGLPVVTNIPGINKGRTVRLKSPGTNKGQSVRLNIQGANKGQTVIPKIPGKRKGQYVGSNIQGANKRQPIVPKILGNKKGQDVGTNIQGGKKRHPIIRKIRVNKKRQHVKPNIQGANKGHPILPKMPGNNKGQHVGSNILEANMRHTAKPMSATTPKGQPIISRAEQESEKLFLRAPEGADETVRPKILKMMEQFVYYTEGIHMANAERLAQQYKEDLGFRLSFIFSRLEQLCYEMHLTYSYLKHNLETYTEDYKRLVIPIDREIDYYTYLVRKNVDVTYAVEYLLEMYGRHNTTGDNAALDGMMENMDDIPNM